MRRMIGWCGIVLLGSFAVRPLAAQGSARATSAKPGRIVGVFDFESGEPVTDADVTDLSTDSVARTEAHGLVELSHFHSHNDSIVVCISKEGFLDTTIVVLVGATDTVPVQVNLRREEEVLPTVVVVPMANGQMERHMRGYEALRRAGAAEYIPRSTLSKYDRESLSVALRLLHKSCDNVSLDGQSIPDTRKARLPYLTSRIEGIELYRKSVPPVFSDKNHQQLECVMVLWTRILPPGEG